jgi:hypothetical protein
VILENGIVRTMEPAMPVARALAVAGERIAGGVGTHETALPSPDRVDLGGRCVLPGFNDAHVHFPTWSLAQREIRLEGTRSLGEAVALVAEAVRSVPPGRWLRGRGWRSGDWSPPTEPTRQVLDEERVLAVFETFGRRPETGCDDGSVRGERLDRDTPEALGHARGVDDDVRRGVHLFDRWDEAGECDVILEVELPDEMMELALVAAVALAIDRQAINQARTLGLSRITGSIIPSSFDSTGRLRPTRWIPPRPSGSSPRPATRTASTPASTSATSPTRTLRRPPSTTSRRWAYG